MRNTSAVQMEFCQIAFQPPALKQTDALWELFSPKIGKFVKTAVLTLGIDILTMTTYPLFVTTITTAGCVKKFSQA